MNSGFTWHVRHAVGFTLSWGQTEAVVVHIGCTCLFTCVRHEDGRWALNLGQTEVVMIHKGCTCCLPQIDILSDWATA